MTAVASEAEIAAAKGAWRWGVYGCHRPGFKRLSISRRTIRLPAKGERRLMSAYRLLGDSGGRRQFRFGRHGLDLYGGCDNCHIEVFQG